MAEEKKTTEVSEEEAPKVKKTTRKTTAKKAADGETAVKKTTTRKTTAKKATKAEGEEKVAKKTTRKTTKKAEVVEEKVVEAKVEEKKEDKKPEITFKTRPATIKDYDLLGGVVITEKTQNLQIHANTLVLRVSNKATADEVKAAVQSVFGVKVDKVNIVNVRARAKRSTRYAGHVPGFKKAYVKVNSKFDLGEIAKSVQAENAQ